MSGERRPLAGNRPLLLRDPDRLWRVAAGAVDLFLVRLDGGRPTGARHPLWRVEAGGLLFPFPADGGWGVLAAGTLETELEAVAWEELDEPQVTGPALVGWLERLPGALGAAPPPQAAAALTAGRIELAAGAAAMALDALCWIEVAAGRARVLGLEALAGAPGGTPLPLAPGMWLVADGEATIVIRDAAPRGAALRAAVERLTAGVLARRVALLAEEERAHRDRLERLAAADRRRVAGVLGGLVEVLGRRKGQAPRPDDPLLAACGIVGRHLGVAVRRPEEPEGSAGAAAAVEGGGTVEEIAGAAGLRTREVRLAGRWWRNDCGPLLAFRRADGAPLALLPGRGGYRAVDPATGGEERLDERVSATLDPRATAFYRSFPRHPLGARDLIRFGAFGLGRDLGMVVLMGLVGGGLGLLPPIAMGKLVDSIIPGAERGPLVQMVGVLVAAALGSALFGVVGALATVRIESHMDASVQAAVWDRILALPLPFFQRYNAGDLANRAMGINAIRRAVSGTTAATLLAGIFSLLNVALMVHYSGRLAAVGLAIVAVLVLASAGAGAVELRYQRQVATLEGRLSGKVLQILKAVAKLRAAGAERRAFAYWADDFARHRRLVYAARLAKAVVTTTTATAPILSSLVLFACYAAWREGATAGLSSGDFLAFIAAFGALSTAGLHTAGTVVEVLKVVPIYERARPILESVPEGADDRSDAGTLRGEVEVAHLSFRYGEEAPEVLVDVSLRAAAGESIAIVGPSGAGKSTLLRLLLGFDEPTSGAIYFDSHHLSDLDPRSVRRQIGVVLQGGQLLGGDILSNILGALPLGVDDAWAAARMAGLEADIQAMPMGMYTLVSEAGGTLSGGQRQRLMIAKALVNRPRLVFFDEATSALDNPTQALVAESLERLQATRVLIAHRLSTIRHVDRIYVLEGGRITESGGYDELLAAGGAFAALARRQIA